MAKQFDELLLETDEEVTSVIEKIKKSKLNRIVVVLPRGAVLGQSIVNLKLVYRQAAEMEKVVAIVSPDRVARNLADRVGFIVGAASEDIEWPKLSPKPERSDGGQTSQLVKKRFDAAGETLDEGGKNQREPAKTTEPELTKESGQGATADRGQTDDVDTKDNRSTADSIDDSVESADVETADQRVAAATKPLSAMASSRLPMGGLRVFRNQKRRPVIIATLIALGVVLLALAVVAVVWPSASVLITVEAKPFNETVTSTVSVETKQLDAERGLVPGTSRETTLETKVSAKTSGKKDQGEKATGEVTIFNAWDSLSHTFSAGTVLVAKNGNQYVTKSDVTVGPATSTISGGNSIITPGKSDVAVVAAAPGEAYNIAASSFTLPSLPKAQQEKIYATSTAAMTGGTSKVVGVATADDIAKLTDTAKNQNRVEAVAKLKADFASEVIIDQAVQTVSQDAKSSVNADDVAETLEVTILGKFSVISFTQNDHRTLIEKLVASKIPQGQTLVTAGTGIELDTSGFEVNIATDKKIELTNRIKAFTVDGFDANQIRRLLVGSSRSSERVVAAVKTKIPATAADVSTRPRWWPRLPYWSQRINLQLQYVGKES